MSFSRVSATGSRKADPLNRRIPENPRYKHIKPTIDTGASVSRYLQQLEEIRRDYRYRKDEVFKRLKVTTFAQLVLQIAGSEDASSVMQTDQEESTLLLSHRPGSQLSADTIESPPSTARSTLSSVVVGMGELDVSGEQDTSPNDSTPPPVCPYLLLDVRAKEDFDQCHIVTAKSYPATMLSRSCNYFTKDILEYKNKPGRIIILYDEDERIAPQAVTTFVQREVDNVFLLSGGLKVLCKAFREVMVAGKAPPSYLQSPPSTSYRTSSSSSQKATVVSSATLTCSSRHKDKFSAGDLEVIRMNMDQVLSSDPSYRASSRSSSRSSYCGNTQSGTRSSRTEHSGAASSRPWK